MKIIVTIDVQDDNGNSLLDETTKKVVETFKGTVVATNVPQQKADIEQQAKKKKGNFSGAIASIAKASTIEEIEEIESLIPQREWTGNELKTITAALEEKKKSIGGNE